MSTKELKFHVIFNYLKMNRNLTNTAESTQLDCSTMMLGPQKHENAYIEFYIDFKLVQTKRRFLFKKKQKQNKRQHQLSVHLITKNIHLKQMIWQIDTTCMFYSVELYIKVCKHHFQFEIYNYTRFITALQFTNLKIDINPKITTSFSNTCGRLSVKAFY